MLSLLLAVSLAASGDPIVRWQATDVTVTGANDTALSGLVSARWPARAYADVLSISCQAQAQGCQWYCSITYVTPLTGAQIKAQLLADGAYRPGPVAHATVKPGADKCYARPNAWVSLLQSLWPELGSNDVLSVTFSRSTTSAPFTASLTYARPLTSAQCATYDDRPLELVGVVP